MLISMDWISDFVKLPEGISPKEVGDKLTMATCEVEEVETVGAHWRQIFVAEITSIEKHPEADKLNLVTFNYGPGKEFRVVCGASNVKVGLRTPYAPVGLTLPNGMTLEPKKIRGILSEGMLCSEEELGMSDSSSGIMELPGDAEIGKNLLDYFNESEDTILDIDNKSLTHRPDLWGHYGMAREFSAVFKQDLSDQFNSSWSKNLKSKISKGDSPIKVSMEKDCAGTSYFGLSMDGIQVKESPAWIKRRLISVGLRPINNIVDISNYVMLELGMPLHIFSRDKIEGGEINIKKLGSCSEFTTLDEVNRNLIETDTVICDAKKPLVIAGIMGGLNSGVTEQTSEIFIEVANWKAADVRNTSTRLGLRTDSSQRYEKSLDGLLCERTMLRTIELVLEVCPDAKVVGSLEYAGEDLAEIKPLVFDISHTRIAKVLGYPIDKNQVSEILISLDFKVEDKGDSLSITTPSYRATKDIDCEADIIEEIGRVIGYDNIVPVSPLSDVKPARLTPAQALHRKLRDFLIYNSNSFEIMTYPMVGEKLLKKSLWTEDFSALKLLNSLSKEQDRMRGSMVPRLLEAAALNSKSKDSFRFFELGRSYKSGKKEFAKEHSELGIVFYNKEENVFLDLVNTASRALKAANIPADLADKHPKFKNEVIDEEWTGVHPFEFKNLRVMGKMKGVILSIHPLLLKSFKIKGHLSIMLLDLTDFEARALKDKTKYSPLPKFPGSNFDYTIELDRNTQAGEILSCLNKFKLKEVKSHKILDIYSSEGPTKSITLRTSFMDPESTLSGEFLKNSEEALLSHLSKNGFNLKQG